MNATQNRTLRASLRTRAEDRRNADRGHFRAFCMAYALCEPGPFSEAAEATMRGLRDAYPKAYHNACEADYCRRHDC